jgi:hypothetical protein
MSESEYMQMLIKRAQELVNTPNVEEKKPMKAKRNISDDRKEDLRQKMITLREKSIISRQAKAKLKKEAPTVTGTEPLKLAPKVDVPEAPRVDVPRVEAPRMQAPAPAPAPTLAPTPMRPMPQYFVPKMSYARKHGFNNPL